MDIHTFIFRFHFLKALFFDLVTEIIRTQFLLFQHTEPYHMLHVAKGTVLFSELQIKGTL